MEFSARMRELRNEKHLTQKQIGDILNVTERCVRAYEGGDRHPDFKGLLFLADYFNVSLDYLVGRTDKREVNR